MTRAETEITGELIRKLLRDQNPDLAGRPLSLGARGWDNQLWRLGGDLAVRVPWATPRADALLLKEHAWLPVLAPRLPLPVPVPQRLGEPSKRFPRPWIITTWILGDPADRAPATRGAEAADALAAFLTALRQPAPAEAPEASDAGGGALADRADSFVRGLTTAVDLELIPDPDNVRAIWDDAVAAPAWDCTPLWLHADLHPANVLTADGALCGVIDSATCAPGTRAVTSPPAGSCCPTALPAGSSRPTSRCRIWRPCLPDSPGPVRSTQDRAASPDVASFMPVPSNGL